MTDKIINLFIKIAAVITIIAIIAAVILVSPFVISGKLADKVYDCYKHKTRRNSAV